MPEIRNILLIGRTGSGKSALGNVLINKNGKFEEVFKESELSVSETRNVQVESFDFTLPNGNVVTYRVIDAIGIGDTKLTNDQVLYKLAKFVEEVKKDGINRIMFTIANKFNKEEEDIYKILRDVFFDKKVLDHTTIVRTKFGLFRNKEMRDEDVESLINSNPHFDALKEIDRDSIVHVDNTPVEQDPQMTNRSDSRKFLIAHLATHEAIYRPNKIDRINDRIKEYLDKEKEEKEKFDRQIKETKKELDKIKEERRLDRERLEKVIKESEEQKKLNESKLTALQEEMKKQVTATDQNSKRADELKEKIKSLKEANKKHEEELERLKKVEAEREQKRKKREKEFQKKIEELRKEFNETKSKNQKDIADSMNDYLKSDEAIIERFAVQGARLGSAALPIVGTGGGAIIGAAVGSGVFIVKKLLGLGKGI